MTDLRTAAQQALEYLGAPSAKLWPAGTQYRIIAALHAALAQQAEPVEPVAWIHTDPDKPRVRFLEWREDEPGYRGRWVKTPLYLAPPQRKPLTDEEIVRIFETPELAGTHFQTPTIKAIAVARAIERAHGIGGQP
jgi:hypothetical protein